MLHYNNINYSQQCYTSVPITDGFLTASPEEFGDNTGPFYIKLNVVVIRRSDGSGGPTIEEANNSINIMKEYFDEHNIFFYHGCINSIHNTDYFNDADLALTDYQNPNDALTILLTNSDCCGRSDGIGADKVWSNNNPKSIAHEVGHALHLYHTFQGGSCSEGDPAINELNDGSNCLTAGDKVCDTGAEASPNETEYEGYDLENCTYSNSECLDPDGEPYTNVDVENIMGYIDVCYNHFTVGQGEYMRSYLTWASSKLKNAQRNWAYLTGNDGISNNHYCDIDIIVAENADATIGANLSMAPNTSIIVERNATLNLYLADIAVGNDDLLCPINDDFWRGIVLKSGNGLTGPASLEIYGSTISGARKAINWMLPPVGPIYPAYVNALASEFYNNENSIYYFNKSYHGSDNWIPFNRQSTFEECIFYIDENFKGEQFNQHVYVIYNRGLNFLSCNFDNTWQGAYGLNRAITAYGSRLAFSRAPFLTNNEVNNFNVGIDFKGSVLGSPYLSNLLINKTNFNSNKISLSASSANYIIVKENTINVDDDEFYSGINISTSTGFAVYDNVFLSPTSNTTTKFGLQIINTTTESNIIDENDFDNLGTAINVFGLNGSDLSGLQLMCNEIQNSKKYDVLINENSSIATQQGSGSDPAGNKFSHNTGIQGSDFLNSTSNESIVYNYNSNDASQWPISYVNILPTGIPLASECSYREFPDLHQDSMSYIYFQFVSVYDSVFSLYQLTTDSTTKINLQGLLLQLDAKINLLCNFVISEMYLDTIAYEDSLYILWLKRKIHLKAIWQ